MASIQGLEAKLSSLEKSARSLSLRAGTAAVNFNEACQTQLIQQVRGHQHGPGETSKPQLLTSSNFQEVSVYICTPMFFASHSPLDVCMKLYCIVSVMQKP